jgi:hypothetical protein
MLLLAVLDKTQGAVVAVAHQQGEPQDLMDKVVLVS